MAAAALTAIMLSAIAPAHQASAGPATGDDGTKGRLGLVPARRAGSPPAAPSGQLMAGQIPGAGPCDVKLCWSPGSPVVAVGPNHVLQTANTMATVYDKSTGTQLARFDFTVWWGTKTTACVDPRAIYMVSVDRFAMSCTDITPNQVSRIHFAISSTNDPTGGWYTYVAPNRSFLDQDKIEATSDKFVVAGNGATFEQLYVYNLADVVAGVTNPSVVGLKAKKSNLYQAAVEQTATSPAYFVSSYPGGRLYLATITGTPAGSDVAASEKAISSRDFPAPIEPAVPGGSIGGGVLDGRIYGAVFEVETSDNKPVIQYSSARLCGNRDCIASARIDLSGPAPALAYDNLIGEPGWDYTYAAPGLDASGNVFQVYTRSSGSTPPGMGVVGPGFDVMLQPAAAGTNSCDGTQQPPCDERWGDYAGTSIDPANPSVVWTTGLYQATSGGYGWGSWIDTVSLDRYSLPTAATGPASNLTQGTATVEGTVNPNGASTTYHFDYGTTSAFDGSTPEQPAGSGTTPINVSADLPGLTANTSYSYRLVASSSVGSADGAVMAFKSKKPKITAVAFTGTQASPTITITGVFGAAPAPDPTAPPGCATGDTSLDFGTAGLWLTDSTQVWTAGHIGDCVGLVVTSFTPTQVAYQLGSYYSDVTPLSDGNGYQVMVDGVAAGGTISGLAPPS